MTNTLPSISTKNAIAAARVWRDHGWRRVVRRTQPRAGDDRICAVIPLTRINDNNANTSDDAHIFDRRLISQCEQAIRAYVRADSDADALADVAVIANNPARVVLRYHAGTCPVEDVAIALAQIGVAPVVSHCKDATLTPVTLTVRGAAVDAGAKNAVGASLVTLAHSTKNTLKIALSSPEIAVVLVGGALLVAVVVLSRTTGIPSSAMYAMLALSAILTSMRTFPEAMRSILGLHVNIDVLMFAAAAGAAAIGHAEEGAFLLFLFGLGSAGEHLAMSHARRSIEALSELAPSVATVIDDDGIATEVPIDTIIVGDTVRIRPFDRIAIDGVVIDGQSSVDETMLTGEPIPVEKTLDSQVFAGTMNAQGVLTVRVSQLAEDTTLARIMRLVEQAQGTKSKAQIFTDRIEKWYVPLVFVMTACVMVIPPALHLNIFGSGSLWATWFYRSMAFMTAASPCALAIGTPATFLCAVARAARMGVLVNGGAAIDTLARTNAIAFDKTGTLTEGKPYVVDVVTTSAISHIAHAESHVLSLAAAVEQSVTHPLAGAVVRAATSRGNVIPDAKNIEQIAGSGAFGTVDGTRISVLKPAAIEASRWPDDLVIARDAFAAQGKTLVVVARGDSPIGIIAIDDRVRIEASEVITSLRTTGIGPIVMLTGDHDGTAARVAQEIDLDERHSSLSPSEKLEWIQHLQREHSIVAMVGDGVNDAPALAQADVGIAIGAAGSHVAMDTADVALLGTTLSNLPGMIDLARASRRTLIQNFVFAMGIILVVAPLGALGFAGLGVAVLLHEGSTILVVLNSLRLLGYRPQ